MSILLKNLIECVVFSIRLIVVIANAYNITSDSITLWLQRYHSLMFVLRVFSDTSIASNNENIMSTNVLAV